MIFLAISPAGLASALRVAAPSDAIWCSSGALSQCEFEALAHASLTRLAYPVEDQQAVSRAVECIKEQHPGQEVWIEGAAWVGDA